MEVVLTVFVILGAFQAGWMWGLRAKPVQQVQQVQPESPSRLEKLAEFVLPAVSAIMAAKASANAVTAQHDEAVKLKADAALSDQLVGKLEKDVQEFKDLATSLRESRSRWMTSAWSLATYLQTQMQDYECVASLGLIDLGTSDDPSVTGIIELDERYRKYFLSSETTEVTDATDATETSEGNVVPLRPVS